MMSSRARKILGLIVENKREDNIIENETDYNLIEELNNSNKDSDHEIQNENSSPLKIMEKSNLENKNKLIEPVVDDLNSKNESSISIPLLDTQPIQSLVPYYDSDITLSDNEDNITQYNKTLEAQNKIEDQSIRQISSSSSSPNSSSSSSSSSSSASDSSSSSSESNSSRPKQHTNSVIMYETDDDIIENTPPDKLSNRTKQLNSDQKNSNKVKYYYTSPIYTDESDIDLSDKDPTYINIEPINKKNYFFIDQSSSSSASSSNSGRVKTSTQEKGYKRRKNPSQWKQNKIKRMRNKGNAYISQSKSQKRVSFRHLKEPCTNKCRLKCTTKINIEERYKLFQKFWDLGDLVKQRAYINASMVDVQPRYKYTNAERPRHNNKAFYFKIDGKMIRVCKTFYKATLDISDRMIFTVQNKIKENDFSFNDLRGTHENHKKIDSEIRAAILEHIKSIPKVESHYLRASTSKEYIEGSKTIKDLYNDFKETQGNQNKSAGTYITYYKIFKNEFKLSFYKPKKDQCDLCTSYFNSNENQKKDIEEKYLQHIEEKDYSRIEKVNDRKKVHKNLRVAVYDLEAVLQCPKGNSSSFYYKSKLNCYNLTLTELTQKESKVAYKNVHCYFWTESDAKRGAVEIGSCLWAYLKDISDEDGDEKELIFYSDNCCGQNKNKYITSLYLYAAQTLNIKSITHKFLIRGHTQNEADSVHSLIEKEIKKNLKSGPIYTPDQYITLIKNAKKSQPPLIVHEMNYESFYDLKILQEEWGYNYTINTDGQNVNWNEIKVLKITKDNPTIFCYKTSYKEKAYKEVNVRNKRKKMKLTTEISLQRAYINKQEISENKKKDLRELISKSLIPSFYAGFYNNII